MDRVPSGGWVEVWTTCKNCKGNKVVADNTTCLECNGEGKKSHKVSLNALMIHFRNELRDEVQHASR
jgi:DnaJ-class molecular chaperone